MSQPYIRLRDFFHGYFHQDWVEEYNDDPVRAVAEFITDQSPEDVKETLAELEFLLNQNFNEEELHKTVLGLGCAYYPPGGGQTYKKWLTDARNQIAEHFGKAVRAYPSASPTPPPTPTSSAASRYSSPPEPTKPERRNIDLNTKELFSDLITRPLLVGVISWLTLGATSCFKISWARLYDLHYNNAFFSESIHNDGWSIGFMVGIVAGLVWGILKITKHEQLGSLVILAGVLILVFVLVKLPLSGRWGDTSNVGTGTGNALASLNGRVASVRFYQMPNYDQDVPYGKRAYKTRFQKSKQRIYISWELDLEHPAPGIRKNLPVNVDLHYLVSGRWNSFGVANYPNFYIEPSMSNVHLDGGWGLVPVQGVKEPITYQADFYVEGQKIASGTFELY